MYIKASTKLTLIITTLLFIQAESFIATANNKYNGKKMTYSSPFFTPSLQIDNSVIKIRSKSSSLAMSSTNEQQKQQQQLSPKALVNRGMNTFRRGNVKESIDLFDEAEASVPGKALTPFLWQRGISYYYADMFEEGSKQFRFDVKVNPLDVEEIVWDIACQNRLSSDFSTPRELMMSLPKGKTDRRKIMSTVYSLFRGDGATEHDLAMAGHSGNQSDEFYSLFYLGLYCESKGEMAKAEQYMKAAKNSAYATGYGSGDYMTDCARVHCQLRGWI